MKLSEEERKAVVAYRLARAKETLTEASVLIENKMWRVAVNRLYYACFYATTALLVNDGYEAHTHSGVKTLLGLHYVRDGRIDKLFSRMYQQLFNLRQNGDYEDWFEVYEEDAFSHLKPVQEFIETIENLINKNN